MNKNIRMPMYSKSSKMIGSLNKILHRLAEHLHAANEIQGVQVNLAIVRIQRRHGMRLHRTSAFEIRKGETKQVADGEDEVQD